MGQLGELCNARFGDLYGPLLHLSGHSRRIFELLLDTPADLEDIRLLMQEGWREHLVGAVAALFHPERQPCRELLWAAFDRGSWVAPQLAICALALDPGDLDEARRRLLLRCPVKSDHLVGVDPMRRHVEHGTAAIYEHNMKGMAALLATFARHEEGRAWLSARLPLEDAFWALEVDTWDHGDDIARSWGDQARAILEELGRPLPDWLKGDVPERLLGLWSLEGQPPAVRLFCTGSWASRLYRLLHAPFQKGLRSLLLEEGRLLAREVSGNRVLLELPPAYLEGAAEYLCQWARDRPLDLREHGSEPEAVKVEQTPAGLQLSLLEQYESPHWLRIVSDRLEDCPCTMWVVGIDAEARLDGGVAAAVRAAAGPGYQDSLREGLAQGGREPGRVVFTESFNLRSQRVFRLAHIVTIPRPPREELVRALERVLAFAPTENLHWIAMPALGCGAAGFQAKDVAGPLLEALARVKDDFVVTLCLPRDADREAFTQAARRRGLLR